ncbi:hypothetical protein CR162_15325 [Pseudoroseomonas rhizosphaerae]|uniref:Uncharacterized protein n=1 Tax=Teichococcus rhizosphaerae TaxID=1335062 RepID=A0A2C6Y016_9PROT|nr:hypothetical protein CR162_15325 [Pseudoroseomonas rhizosphaerae]
MGARPERRTTPSSGCRWTWRSPAHSKPHAPLWLRPDKLAAARAALATGRTTIALLADVGTGATPWRVRGIVLDRTFLDRAEAFKRRDFRLRGFPKTYALVPAADPAVLSWDATVAVVKGMAPATRRPAPWVPPGRFAPPAPAVSRTALRLVPAAAPRAPAPVIGAAPGRVPGTLPRPVRFSPFRQRERVAA